MTKTELIEAVRAGLEGKGVPISSRKTEVVVETVLGELFSSLLVTGNVKLRGYGSLAVKKRKLRTKVYNPRTMEPVEPKDSWRIKFTPSKRIEDVLNNEESLNALRNGEQ